jgi:ribA/ribD-fused uncharacterized protein
VRRAAPVPQTAAVLPRSVTELVELVSTGARVDYLHFWRNQPPGAPAAGPGCLSQWAPSPFEVDGRRFATAEHWMMWRKAVLFGDDEVAAQVLRAPTPFEAKQLGGRARGFDRRVWEAERFGIVVAGNVAKFAAHDDLRAYLLGTRGRVLVEASPKDRIWGIGLAEDDPRAADPATWRGLNLLGFALMQAREQLARRAADQP